MLFTDPQSVFPLGDLLARMGHDLLPEEVSRRCEGIRGSVVQDPPDRISGLLPRWGLVRLLEYLRAVQWASQDAQGPENILDALPEVPSFFLEPPDSGKL